MNKWLATINSRKAVAVALAVALPVLNKIFDLGFSSETIIAMMTALCAWAGIEYGIDVAKIKNGSGPEVAKLLDLMQKAFDSKPVDPPTAPPESDKGGA